MFPDPENEVSGKMKPTKLDSHFANEGLNRLALSRYGASCYLSLKGVTVENGQLLLVDQYDCHQN